MPKPDAYQKYASAALRHVDRAMKKNIRYTVSNKSRRGRKIMDH